MKALDLLLIIDMGHGGSDPGASGNGIVEKVANFNTGMALKKYFEGKGITVILTRTGDSTKSLSQRTSFANVEAKKYGKKKAIYISVHHNAGGGDRGEYIYSIHGGAGKEIAEAIGTEMNKQLGQQKKCYTKKGTDNKDYYYVIKNTSMPAVIVEVAFLDNKTDVQICDTVAEQERNGRVIGDGILNWAGITVESNPKPPATQKQLWEISIQGEEVKSLQKVIGVKCDGYFGNDTLKACPVLRQSGAYSSIVLQMQKRLNKLGHNFKADGYLGPTTLKYVKEFQKARKLTIDGVVGKNTWTELYKK